MIKLIFSMEHEGSRRGVSSFDMSNHHIIEPSFCEECLVVEIDENHELWPDRLLMLSNPQYFRIVDGVIVKSVQRREKPIRYEGE